MAIRLPPDDDRAHEERAEMQAIFHEVLEQLVEDFLDDPKTTVQDVINLLEGKEYLVDLIMDDEVQVTMFFKEELEQKGIVIP